MNSWARLSRPGKTTGGSLIYPLYQTVRQATRPLAWMLDESQRLARDARNPWRGTLTMRALATAFELPARGLKTYGKPKFEVTAFLGDLEVALEPAVVLSLPFADLLRFTASSGGDKPKVLIAAALSGHHATLLEDTVAAFVQDHEVYITDWKDAREVPLEAGPFGLDDYVDYLVAFMRELGPGSHMVATCQAAPPAMVAAALLARDNADCAPRSLTLMGGPIDTRVAPGMLNKMTHKLPLRLFEANNLHTVPRGYPGAGRKVYPGFYQLAGFIALNPKPHLRQYADFVRNSLRGDEDFLDKFRAFYDEYFAVLDMDAAFYMETLERVFFEHHIPRGLMRHGGTCVDFAAVKDTSLLTVEGANDSFCPPGQTEAAHAVFAGLPPARKRNHVQPGVGHYGVFSGTRFRAEIYPLIRDFIASQALTARVPAPVKNAVSARRADAAPRPSARS